jgi:hypothetical protein
VLDAFLPAGQTEFSATAGQLDKNRTATTGGCFPTLANYQAALGTPKPTGTSQTNAASPISKFGQNSVYFRLTSFITIGGAEFNLYSLLYRDATGAVRPIQRSFAPD